MTQSAKVETVILLHGTFANPSNHIESTSPPWWRPDSKESHPFQNMLDKFLDESGSGACCWAHLNSNWKEFEWSGRNSELERRTAQLAFRRYLSRLEADENIWKYHVVCHSHGGYIANRALLELAMGYSSAKLGSVVFLGTPFVRSRSDRIVTHVLVPHRKKVLAVCAAVSGVLVYSLVVLSYISTAILGLIFAGSVLLAITAHRFVRVEYPRCRLVVINSRYDETIIALRNVLALRRVGFRDFFDLPKLRMPKGILWSRSTAFRNLAWASPWLLVIRFFNEVRTKGASWSKKIPSAWGGLLGIGTLCISAPVILVDWLFGLAAIPFRYGGAFFRSVSMAYGVRRIAKTALGEDLPFDKIEAIAELPRELEERTTKLDISNDIEEDMRKYAVHDIGMKLSSTYEVSVGGTLLTDRIRDIFTNTALVHSQYMRNEKLIKLVARAIAK